MNPIDKQRNDSELLADDVCHSLDDSIENLDGNTLSRLNAAKHIALEQGTVGRRKPVLIAAALSLCLLVVVFVNKQPHSATENYALPADEQWQLVQDDVEMMSNLDLIMWLSDPSDGNG